jgi:type I restriction enzyme S subunit
VEFKDSGIEWIGEIPKEWEVKRVKNTYTIFKKIVGENSKKFNLLSLTQNGVVPRDINSGIGKFPAEFNTYQIIENNDLIFCLFDMDVTPRTIGIATMNGMITGAYTVIKSKEQVLNKYYYYLFLSADIYKKLSPYYTGLRNTIKKEKFLSLGIPQPLYKEQIQIANYLDEKTQKIDNITQTISKKIELLKEFRKTLINDAVTGKIKVA